jgi:AraC-like DNA-binding protein
MIGTPQDLTDRPDLHWRTDVDVLTDMLSSLRLTGGVFLDGEFHAPWAVLSQIGPAERALFFTEPHHVIAYHFVRSGSMTCQVGDDPPVRVSAGEIVLMPRNDPHCLTGPVPAEAVATDQIVSPPGEDGLFRIRYGDEDGELTSIYCGFLATQMGDDPLLQALPPMMTVSLDMVRDDWMVKSIAFAAESLGSHSPEMVGKLSEALFAEAVRRYLEALPAEEAGWIAGLRDPAVGKALGLIHGRYAEAWTVDTLARECGVSRTVLNDRFRSFVGEAPMQYCGRIRMRAAANMLRDERQNASNVAYAVGFNSEAAFNRAFKREYGVPPGTWSRSQRGL